MFKITSLVTFLIPSQQTVEKHNLKITNYNTLKRYVRKKLSICKIFMEKMTNPTERRFKRPT